MTDTKRRRFLKRSGLLLLSLAALAVGLVRWIAEWRERAALPTPAGGASGALGAGDEQATRAEQQIASALREEFAYLEIDPELFERFAADYLRDRRRTWRPGRPLSQRDRMRFLLSTDFFQHGADERRPLRYVAYYQPYATPCYNPLAQPAEEV